MCLACGDAILEHNGSKEKKVHLMTAVINKSIVLMFVRLLFDYFEENGALPFINSGVKDIVDFN